MRNGFGFVCFSTNGFEVSFLARQRNDSLPRRLDFAAARNPTSFCYSLFFFFGRKKIVTVGFYLW